MILYQFNAQDKIFPISLNSFYNLIKVTYKENDKNFSNKVLRI